MTEITRQEVGEWCRQKFYLEILKQTGVQSKLGVADKFLIQQIADSYSQKAFEIVGVPCPLENVNSRNVGNYLTSFGF